MATLGSSLGLTGIILHLGHLGEAHRLVECLTPSHGRVTLIARGARASRRRFAGLLDPFNLLTMQTRVPRAASLWPLHEAHPAILRHGALRLSLPAMARGAGIVGCVRSLWPEHQPAPDAFDVLARALDYLDAGARVRAAGAYIHLARLSGIMPDLTRCTRCGAHGRELGEGGDEPALVCRVCRPSLRVLSPAMMTALNRGRVDSDEVADGVERLITGWASSQGSRRVMILPV